MSDYFYLSFLISWAKSHIEWKHLRNVRYVRDEITEYTLCFLIELANNSWENEH